MQQLTSGERIVRCFTGQEIDRVPYGVGVGWMPWEETTERWRNETGRAELDPHNYFGFDACFALPDLVPGIYPTFETQVIEETEETITVRDERGVTLRNRRDRGSMPEFLDYPVKTPDDWQKLKEERLHIEDPQRVRQDWDEFRSRLKRTGEVCQVGWYPYGVFGAVRDLLGVEEMLVSFHTEPEMIRDMMDHLTSLWLSLWEKVARQVHIDHVLLMQERERTPELFITCDVTRRQSLSFAMCVHLDHLFTNVLE